MTQAGVAIAGLALAVALWACGNAVTTPSITPSLTPEASPIASPAPAGSGAVIADPGLLAVLPPEIEGLTPQADPARDDELLRNPTVAELGTGFASALYIDPAIGDFAYATVLRLRDDMDDATYRSWRDSFDEGACSQAGGVTGHAEAEVGGHATFIGTCDGGVRTYHTVTGDGLLVSVSSISERRLGERVIEGLRALP